MSRNDDLGKDRTGSIATIIAEHHDEIVRLWTEQSRRAASARGCLSAEQYPQPLASRQGRVSAGRLRPRISLHRRQMAGPSAVRDLARRSQRAGEVSGTRLIAAVQTDPLRCKAVKDSPEMASEGLHRCRACFETRSSSAPQHEVSLGWH